MGKWFYADRAIRLSSFRLPAYRGSRSGTPFRRLGLQKLNEVLGLAGAAGPPTSGVLFLAPEPSAPDQIAAANLFQRPLDPMTKGRWWEVWLTNC